MAHLLNESHINLINQIINEPHMLKMVGMGKLSIDVTEEFHLMDYYISDDGLDLAIFEKPDIRVFQGHNCFRSTGFQCVRNGREILKQVFLDHPYLETIYGLTPIENEVTIRFNKLVNMKFTKFEWLENGKFASRFEIKRK